jgi:hypothetical protein
MFVAQVVMPASRRRSWTVLGADRVRVEPVERYLAFLTDVDRFAEHGRRGRVGSLPWRGGGWRSACGCAGLSATARTVGCGPSPSKSPA